MNEVLGSVGEVGDHVRNIAFRDVSLSGVEEDASERGLASTT